MRRPPSVDPSSIGESFALRQRRWKPLRGVLADIGDRGRYGEEADRLDRRRTDETLPAVFRENVGSSDAGSPVSYTTRRMVPSASGTYATTAGFADPMPSAGEVSVGRLWSSEARTAGNAKLQVRIVHGGVTTDYDLPEVILDGTGILDGLLTRSVAAADRFAWGDGIPFEAGATIQLRMLTDGNFTPATADMGAQITVTYGEIDA